jgi:hypothetical protein
MQTKSRYFPVALLLVFIGCSLNTAGQYFSLGQDPASVRWKMIQTTHFQIIYPGYYESRAQYLAGSLEQVARQGIKTLTSSPRKISLILHTQSVSSNAMVPWAPRRMEFFTPPPQDAYAQPWLDQLILHEYRHVQQIEKMNQGFTGALYYIFGEQAAAAMIGLFVPFWFLEGDAVSVETGWSHAGRGREPSFTMPLRAQITHKKIYSYDKAIYGSYKDFVPDHYVLGYQLVGLSRVKYGPQLWEVTINNVARKPFMLVPFNYGLKKNAGLPKAKLYRLLLQELDFIWSAGNSMTISDNESQSITLIPPKTYTSFRHPSEIPGQGIMAERSSLNDINRYVLIRPNGTVKKIKTPGFNFTHTLSHSADLITWSSYRADPRWDNRSYAVIHTYDLSTGKTSQLTRKSRIFAPALSGDGKKIAAIRLDRMDESVLVVLDAATGTVLSEMQAPEGTFLMTPSWWPGDKEVVLIGMNASGKALLKLDPVTGTLKNLTPWSHTEIYLPKAAGKYIYFTGTYSGQDEICALDTGNLQVFGVTTSPFGATDANTNLTGDTLLFSSYTADGYRLMEMPVRPGQWHPVESSDRFSNPMADSLARMEQYIFDGSELPDTAYPSKAYRKWKNLFNIHSWGPFSLDVDNQDFYPGASILSQNKLSTAFTSIGYKYDLNEKTGRFYADFSYQGWYPVLDLSYEVGNRAGTYIDSHDNAVRFTYRENTLSASARVPLRFLVSKWYLGVQPTLGSTLIFIKHNESTPHEFIEGRIQSMEYRLLTYAQIKSSYRDIYPKWNLTLDLNFRNTPFGGNSVGNIGSAETYLFLPGFVRHHGFRLYLGHQQKQRGDYYFSDLISYPRGFSGIFNDRATSVSAGYKFPFLYPDWAIGPLLYIQRLKASLWWDYAWGETKNKDNETVKNEYQSVGLDLTADLHILRFLAPADMGVRTIFFPDGQDFRVEFLFSMNFDTFYTHEKPYHR